MKHYIRGDESKLCASPKLMEPVLSCDDLVYYSFVKAKKLQNFTLASGELRAIK